MKHLFGSSDGSRGLNLMAVFVATAVASTAGAAL
jgi:hypothetical protein